MNYYAEKFEKYKLDMRRTWSTINEALNKIKKKDAFLIVLWLMVSKRILRQILQTVLTHSSPI